MKIIRPIQIKDSGSFTRASTATYHDRHGILQTAAVDTPRFTFDPSDLTKPPVFFKEVAATNLLTYSEQFDNATWTRTGVSVTPNAVVSPNGQTTAVGITSISADGLVYSFVPASSLVTYTHSIWLKALAPTSINIFLVDAGGGAGNTMAVCNVTSEWQRFSVTRTTSAGTTLCSAQIGGANSFTSGEAIFAWGAQLEIGPLATSYISTQPIFVSRATTGTYYDSVGNLQTAAIDVPRFTYDLSNLSAGPGLLLEAAATNLILNSAVVVNQTISISIAGNYTLSFTGTGSISITGAATETVGPGGFTPGIRSHLTFNVPSPGPLFFTITGTVTFGQLEAGTFFVNTSYIPTAGTPVTRAADIWVVNNTRTAEVNTLGMLSLLPEDEYPTLVLNKIYIFGERAQITNTGRHKIYESATGFELLSGVSLSIAAAGIVTWPGHGLPTGTPFCFTAGTLPTGVVLNTVYYVLTVLSINTFTISATVGGAAITTTGTAGTGLSARGGSNFNKDPTLYPDIWLDAGSTNKWAMLDASVQSQTSGLDYIGIVVPVPSNGLADSVVFQNIENGNSARVVMTDAIEGVVYDRTINLISNSGIQDIYSWLFEPVVRVTDIAITDLPPYTSATISSSILGIDGSMVKCGLFVAGKSKTIGSTQSGLSLGIQNYSVKDTDKFGNTTVLEGAYSRTMNASVWVDNTNVDSVINLMNSLRATPMVYIGSEQFNSSILYGYYKDYTNGIDYQTVSVLHLEIESLA